MKFKAKDSGKVRIIELTGRIVLGDGDRELVSAVQAALNEGCRNIVRDLSGVPYMDSSGLGHSAICKKRSVEKEAGIAVVIPRSSGIPVPVQFCLRLTYEAFDTVIDAVGSFAK